MEAPTSAEQRAPEETLGATGRAIPDWLEDMFVGLGGAGARGG